MRIVKNVVWETEHVVFEPGNCTKYNLLVTYIHGEMIVMTDLNNDQVVKFNPVTESAKRIQIRLEEHGYGSGDAKPMSEMLSEVFKSF